MENRSQRIRFAATLSSVVVFLSLCACQSALRGEPPAETAPRQALAQRESPAPPQPDISADSADALRALLALPGGEDADAVRSVGAGAPRTDEEGALLARVCFVPLFGSEQAVTVRYAGARIEAVEIALNLPDFEGWRDELSGLFGRPQPEEAPQALPSPEVPQGEDAAQLPFEAPDAIAAHWELPDGTELLLRRSFGAIFLTACEGEEGPA